MKVAKEQLKLNFEVQRTEVAIQPGERSELAESVSGGDCSELGESVRTIKGKVTFAEVLEIVDETIKMVII